jgi:hypothetical protein
MAATVTLTKEGKRVYSPVVYGHGVCASGKLPGDWDYWMWHCLGMLAGCNRLVVLRLPGWMESKGVAQEMCWARQMDMAVEFMEV